MGVNIGDKVDYIDQILFVGRQHGGQVTAEITPDHEVYASGQSLYVMPETGTQTGDWSGKSLMRLGLGFAWLLSLVAIRGRRMLMLVGLPLTIIMLGQLVQFQNVVPANHIRLGNIFIYGVPTLVLLVWGIAWAIQAFRDPKLVGRIAAPPVACSIALLAAGAALATWMMIQTPVLIDVGYASAAGAELVIGGLTVYGNILDISYFLLYGGTYGPIAYIVYAPAALFTDVARTVVLTTNVALWFVLVAAMWALGARTGGRRVGAWAASFVSLYPPLVFGVATGNNDIVPTLFIGLALLVLHRPALRVLLLMLAAFTKYLPLLAIPMLLRLRGEPMSVLRTTLVTATASGLLIAFLGVHDIRGLRAFWKDVVEGQLQRDNLASLWGLTGLDDWRYLAVAAMVMCAIAGVVATTRHGRDAVPWATAGTLSVAFAALPQYYAVYVALLMPLTAAMLLGPRALTPQTTSVDHTGVGD